jgi:peptide-methionine (S)-S-oxide reductase
MKDEDSVLIQRATLSGGCLEKLETRFKILVGIISTNVGYCKGIQNNSSLMCSDSNIINTIDIEFDSSILSYQNLLTIFFQVHNPTEDLHYPSIIFVHDEKQKNTATKLYNKLNDSIYQNKLKTKIKSFESFYIAAQKYQDKTIHNLA